MLVSSSLVSADEVGCEQQQIVGIASHTSLQMLLQWIHDLHQNGHHISAVDVQVVGFLLHEIFTTEIYHLCFTSASGEKHTIVI